MHTKFITIAITIICGLSLLACDPSESAFAEDLDAASESSAEETSESLDAPVDAPDLGTLDEAAEPCGNELDLEAVNTEEQTVGLCWINGVQGSTTTTTSDVFTGNCCGIGNAWKQKKKIQTTKCCVNGTCHVTFYSENTYCTASLCWL